MNVKLNTLATMVALLTLAGSAMAGMIAEANARTQQEKEKAVAMIAAGAALLPTIVGIPAGTALIAADNEDGTRSCWVKVLDSTDITDAVAYEKYRKMGLPVDELLKHTEAAIHPPVRGSKIPRVILRNRRAEHFHLRPTANEPDFMMYHAERVPKMLTWPAGDEETED